MVTKPKSVPSTAAVSPSSPLAQEPPPPNDASATSQTAVIMETASTSTVADTTPVSGDSNSFLSGDVLQTSIANMVEMGFARDQVVRALRASFNNPDRAVEYLMNGIPSHLDIEASSQARGSPTAAPVVPPVAGGTSSPAPVPTPPPTHQNLFQLAHQQQQQQQPPHLTGINATAPPALNLSALRDNPQIQQLRDLVGQNPALIQPLIQQLASSNPAIAQLLAQNPEALLHLLGPLEADEEGNAPDSSPQVISVTEEERAAIERLEALGFPRYAVVEAYFACDKNEELAANYLFERDLDD